MKYFESFPKLFYNNTLATNILIRIVIDNSDLNSSVLYYDYPVKEDDSLEIISDKYYGSVDYWYVIALTNLFLDPQFSLPTGYRVFDTYIENKYSAIGANNAMTGLAYAQYTTHPQFGYRTVITTTDSISNQSTTIKYYIDSANYANTPAYSTIKSFSDSSTVSIIQTKETLSIYQYEQEVNENKRTIKILKKDYLEQFNNQLKSLLGV